MLQSIHSVKWTAAIVQRQSCHVILFVAQTIGFRGSWKCTFTLTASSTTAHCRPCIRAGGGSFGRVNWTPPTTATGA